MSASTTAPVAFSEIRNNTLLEAVDSLMKEIDWRSALGDAHKILLKPNLGLDYAVAGATTSPALLQAVAQFFSEHGISVIIIEADQVIVDVERAAFLANVPWICDRYGSVSWHNLSKGTFSKHRLNDAYYFYDIDLPEILASAPIVTLPVLKTHAKTGMSGALKNQWALLPVDRYRHHPHVHEGIADLYRIAPPSITIMDATICMEGNGPKSGTQRDLGYVFASTDAYAMDVAATRLMGIPTEQIEFLNLLKKQGAPEPIVGENFPQVEPFKRANHNFVSRVEDTLQRSRLSNLVMQGAPFDALCWAAKNWYRMRHLALRDRV